MKIHDVALVLGTYSQIVAYLRRLDDINLIEKTKFKNIYIRLLFSGCDAE